MQQSLALAARVTQLENEKASLARDARQLGGQLSKANADLALLRARGRAGGEPAAAALEALHAAEARAQAAEAQLASLRLVLGETEIALARAEGEASDAKRDLERLLKERRGLESMKAAVVAALAAQGQGQAEQGAGARSASTPVRR